MVIRCDTDAFVEPDQLSPQIRKVEGTLARIAPKKGTLKDMVHCQRGDGLRRQQFRDLPRRAGSAR